MLSEMKEKISKLEQERENLMKDKEGLEKKLMESSLGSSGSGQDFEQILAENEQLRVTIASIKKMPPGDVEKEVASLLRTKGSLLNEVASLKQALHQSKTTSTLNLSLQQEVARLTDENLVREGESEGGRGHAR